jgi:NAD(P)-dependent dehydrogenase (short-subunit alcohol dehydrogenase family)
VHLGVLEVPSSCASVIGLSVLWCRVMNALASCPKAQPGGSANPLTSLAALPLDLSVAGRADTTEDVGEVDILINNAGIALFGPTAEFDVSAFDKMFASNVRAPFFLVAAFAPGMAARGHGSIVSLSSMAGGVGLVGGAAYGATKASLEAMTRAWAAEYSASGVRVNAIAPGPVYTPSPSGPQFITALGETTPMHRASQPEEIAEVVAFLASPRASYITGTTVAADGGRRAI